MPIYPVLYESDDVTPFADRTITVDPGANSDVWEAHLWNDIGSAHGDADTIHNPRIRVQAWDGAKYVSSGLPVLDALYGRVTVIGVDNAGDSTFPDYQTDSIPVGASSDVPLPDIPKGCAVKFQFQLKVPGDAAGGSVQLRLRGVYDVSVMPLSRRVTAGGGDGVFPSARDAGLRRILSGRHMVSNADDTVTVSAGQYAYDGVTHVELESVETLEPERQRGCGARFR